MKSVKIIPCLDIKEGRVVKGINFINLKDARDPVEAAQTYCQQGADELVFLDIFATVENRGFRREWVKKVREVTTIPFTVGGGINTLEDIKQQIYIIVKRICRHVGEYKSNNNEPPVVVKEVVRFIEENYKDSNLAIATIADYFNLNPDYLSRIFKRYTGESMLHYINRLRVNMAKKLLKETNMGINDIMTESGFTNSSSFFRIFKKREGITPNQYRADN